MDTTHKPSGPYPLYLMITIGSRAAVLLVLQQNKFLQTRETCKRTTVCRTIWSAPPPFNLIRICRTIGFGKSKRKNEGTDRKEGRKEGTATNERGDSRQIIVLVTSQKLARAKSYSHWILVLIKLERKRNHRTQTDLRREKERERALEVRKRAHSVPVHTNLY